MPFLNSMENPPLSLLEQCKGNDRKAHFSLYQWCFDDLISICRRYYKNDDELKSAVNMSFLKIIQSLETIISKYDDLVFFHWMKKITINYIIDEFRKNKRYKETIDLKDEAEILKSEHGYSDDRTSLYENLAVIQRAIDTLPEMSKAVFNLYAIDGYKHEEIGELLNISTNTSKVHYFRAKQKLQVLLSTQKSLLQ
jgi:RNA polymerase sigma-70 factor (ECF subfamily)